MRTVYKYNLTDQGIVLKLELPEGAKVLLVAQQGRGVYAWIEVDTSRPIEERTFIITGTGERLPETDGPLEHIGSATADYNGTFVFHFWERVQNG